MSSSIYILLLVQLSANVENIFPITTLSPDLNGLESSPVNLNSFPEYVAIAALSATLNVPSLATLNSTLALV